MNTSITTPSQSETLPSEKYAYEEKSGVSVTDAISLTGTDFAFSSIVRISLISSFEL
ncbi:MAG: hypothetical protein HFK05_03935 [Clostridia bacterium]|nr:hypothetical protein [Clostridia bacterium]